MAETTKKIIEIEIDVESGEISKVGKEVKGVDKNIKSAEKSTQGLTGSLDRMTGGAISGFLGMVKGIKAGILGLKSFKIALISTGIGALLVAVGSLVAYFTTTKKGAEQLEVAFAAVGAAIDVIKDRISLIGEAITKVFQGDFTGAAEAAKKSVQGLGEEIAKETIAMIALTDALQKIKDAEREFSKERAKTNRVIAEARFIAEDETKAYSQRIKALEKANELEIKTTEKALDLARRKLEQKNIEVKQSNSLAENLDVIAQLEIDVINLETSSFSTRKRLATGLETLRREAAAAENARINNISKNKKEAAALELKTQKEAEKAREEADAKRKSDELAQIEHYKLLDSIRLQLMADGIEKELLMSAQKYDALYAQAEGNAELQRQINERQAQDAAAITAKYEAAAADSAKKTSDAELKTQQELRDKKIAMTSDAIGAAIALNNSFVAKTGAAAKRQFQINKALQIANVTANVISGITAAFASNAANVGATVASGGAYPFIQAGIAAAFGATQIAAIASTKFKGGSSGGGGSVPTVPSGGGRTPNFNTVGNSQTNQLANSIADKENKPVKAYVVSTDVSSQQSLDRNSKSKSSFG